MRKNFIFISAAIFLFSLAGCTTTQQGAGTGAVVGGGIGAIIGHQSGETGAGAGIGAAVGAVTGAVIGNKMGEKKYCPVCGRRFQKNVEYCPYDGAKLKIREE